MADALRKDAIVTGPDHGGPGQIGADDPPPMPVRQDAILIPANRMFRNSFTLALSVELPAQHFAGKACRA